MHLISALISLAKQVVHTYGQPYSGVKQRKMIPLFPPQVEEIGRRQGIQKNLDVSTDKLNLAGNTRICKVYSAILDDIDKYDPPLARDESQAIYRIVEEVHKKLLSRTVEKMRRQNHNLKWLEEQENELRALQIRLDHHKIRTKYTKLSQATLIELLCRLVATKSAKPGWGIGRSFVSSYMYHDFGI